MFGYIIGHCVVSIFVATRQPVFLFILCFIAHSYEANGGTDMELLACFRPVFFPRILRSPYNNAFPLLTLLGLVPLDKNSEYKSQPVTQVAQGRIKCAFLAPFLVHCKKVMIYRGSKAH